MYRNLTASNIYIYLYIIIKNIVKYFHFAYQLRTTFFIIYNILNFILPLLYHENMLNAIGNYQLSDISFPVNWNRGYSSNIGL